VRGRRIKLRYAHQGGRNPPVIVIHGNQTDATPDSYRRYLDESFPRGARSRRHAGPDRVQDRRESRTRARATPRKGAPLRKTRRLGAEQRRYRVA
jgi:hypothetical protein